MTKEELEQERDKLQDLSRFGGLDADGQRRLTDITIKLLKRKENEEVT